MKPHWPKTPLVLGGRRYDLCFNLGAVAEAQQEFDRRGHDVNLLEVLPELTLANVRILFRCGLRKCHPELECGAVRTLVTWEAVFLIAGALRASWHAAAPRPVEESKRNDQSAPSRPLTKDQQWERLWSLACYDLRLSTEEFYGLTLGQLDSLFRRHERAIQEREFLFGQLASCTVNFSMGRPKDPVRPRDFMPSEWGKNPDPGVMPKKKKRSRQVIAMELRANMDAFMRRKLG